MITVGVGTTRAGTARPRTEPGQENAIALAVGASRLLSHDTIYTLKLRRRGIDIDRSRARSVMSLLRVADAMQAIPLRLAADTSAGEAVGLLAQATADSVAVIDERGIYVGAITAKRLEQALREDELDARLEALSDPTPPLRATQSLEDALTSLLRSEQGLPVVDEGTNALVGWLTHTDVLHAYNAQISRGEGGGGFRSLSSAARSRPAAAAARGRR